MKKDILVIMLGIMFLTVSIGSAGEARGRNNNDLIRLHVLANSDSEADQALKYKVKDEIVKEFGEKFRENKSIEDTRKYLKNNLSEIEKVAESKLKELGSDYKVEAQLGNFQFPTKYYGSFSLPAGEYEAVRVVIGKGNGANWWCVLFPPMCFVQKEDNSQIKNGYSVQTGTTKHQGIKVRFKLLEWISESVSTLANIFK